MGQIPRKDEVVAFPQCESNKWKVAYFWSGNLYLSIFFASVILPIVTGRCGCVRISIDKMPLIFPVGESCRRLAAVNARPLKLIRNRGD